MYTHHPLTERELGNVQRHAKTPGHGLKRVAGDVVAAAYLVLAALLTLTIAGISVLEAVL